MMTPDTQDGLLSKTHVVFLNASFDTLWSHVKKSSGNRPLLLGDEDESMKKLENLLNERLPIYQKAHCTIDCNDKNVEEMVDILIQEITDYE